MSKSYIGFLVVAALALLISRLVPDKMWIAAIIVVGALIWAMMKREDERLQTIYRVTSVACELHDRLADDWLRFAQGSLQRIGCKKHVRDTRY